MNDEPRFEKIDAALPLRERETREIQRPVTSSEELVVCDLVTRLATTPADRHDPADVIFKGSWRQRRGGHPLGARFLYGQIISLPGPEQTINYAFELHACDSLGNPIEPGTRVNTDGNAIARGSQQVLSVGIEGVTFWRDGQEIDFDLSPEGIAAAATCIRTFFADNLIRLDDTPH